MIPATHDHAWLTTEEAAAYLRLAGPSSIRAAIARGWLVPDGKNGPRGTYLFRHDTLDAYAARWVPKPAVPKAARPPAMSSMSTPASQPPPPRAAPQTNFRAAMKEAIEQGRSARYRPVPYGATNEV